MAAHTRRIVENENVTQKLGTKQGEQEGKRCREGGGACKAPLDAIGLDHDEGLLHRHCC